MLPAILIGAALGAVGGFAYKKNGDKQYSVGEKDGEAIGESKTDMKSGNAGQNSLDDILKE